MGRFLPRVQRLFVAILTTCLMLPATSSGAVASSCASGGRCRIGDVGPGGGVIFYVASGPQWWGSYLEARPVSRTGVAWSLRPQDSLYGDSDKNVVQRRRIDAKALGMGRVNTEAIVEQSGPGTYAAAVVARQTLGGKRDWFLPSKNELNVTLCAGTESLHRRTFVSKACLHKQVVGIFVVVVHCVSNC